MEKNTRDFIHLWVNGASYEIKSDDAFMMLADFLRQKLKLCGTKIVCAEGDCGACTVLCHKNHSLNKKFFPINACIMPVLQLDGCQILTIEGLNRNPSARKIKDAVIFAHGSQCGFCTPGFVMAMAGMFEEKATPVGEQTIKNHLTGNLCRCTGYKPLITAALSLNDQKLASLSEELLVSKPHEQEKSPIELVFGSQKFFSPVSLDEAVAYKKNHPDCHVLAGGSDLGVFLNKRKITRGNFLSLQNIEGLEVITESMGRIYIPAKSTLSSVRDYLKTIVPEFARLLNIFASPQIKNVATLVGNVANASSIGDTLPFLLIADAKVHVYGKDGEKEIDLLSFFKGYRTTCLEFDEIITHLSFKKIENSSYLRLYKISQRKDLDISTVSCAFLMDINEEHGLIEESKIAMGGIAAIPLRLTKTERFLHKKLLTTDSVHEACSIIEGEITPLSDVRAGKEYRKALSKNLFRRFCHEIMEKLDGR